MKRFNMFFFVLIVSMLIFSGCVDQSGAKEAKEVINETQSASMEKSSLDTTDETSLKEDKQQEIASNEENSNETGKDKEVEESQKNKEADNKDKVSKKATKKSDDKSAQTKSKEVRIIATSAATCDIMDRLGINLVGVPNTTVSTIAARYDDVKRIGTPMGPDMEIIKSLKPTDVVGPDTLKSDLKMKYDNIGVSSTFINLRSVKGLYDSVKAIGERYGKQKEANEMLTEYDEFLKTYSSGHEGEKKPKVLVLMGLPGSYLVATNQSYAGSLVELAGGTNVFQSDTKDFLTINTEEILKTDPDVIIRTAHGLPKEAQEMFKKEFSENDIWKHFRAVQNNKVFDVDYMIFGMSATFDYPQALSDLEPMLYGE